MFFDWVKPANWYFTVCFSMLWCYAIVLEKGRRSGLDPLKRLIPLQMFAPVLSQESDISALIMWNCSLLIIDAPPKSLKLQLFHSFTQIINFIVSICLLTVDYVLFILRIIEIPAISKRRKAFHYRLSEPY